MNIFVGCSSILTIEPGTKHFVGLTWQDGHLSHRTLNRGTQLWDALPATLYEEVVIERR